MYMADDSAPAAAPALPPLMKRLRAQMKLMMIIGRMGGPEDAAKAEGGASGEGGEWDEERLAMLKDSYMELTGRSMPSYLTPELALAELKKYALVYDDEEEEAEPEKPAEESSGSTKGKFRSSILAIKMMKRMKSGIIPKEQMVTKTMLADNEWDAEALQMLKASYAELMGHTMPSYLTPAQAWKELQQFNPYTALEPDEAEGNGEAAPAPAPAPAPAAEEEPAPSKPAAAASSSSDKTKLKQTAEVPTLSEKSLRAKEEKMRAEEAAAAKKEEAQVNDSRPAESVVDGGVFKPNAPKFGNSGAARVHDGWLKKRGEGMFGGFGMTERWFVLHDDAQLHYFVDNSLQMHKGTIDLKGVAPEHIMRLKPRSLDDFTFVIKAPGRDWQLNPGSDDAWRAWRKQLLKVVNPNGL